MRAIANQLSRRETALFLLAVVLGSLLLAGAGAAALPGRAYANGPVSNVALAAADGSDAGGADARKLVVVGDSYSCAMKKGITPWPNLLVKKAGLTRSQYTFIRHPGYAFARKGHRFISLIRKHDADPAVTHVLIMGGVGNDYVTTYKNSISYYKKTVKLLKATYPNARIMHAVTSWRLNNKSYQKAIVKRIPKFKSTAAKIGVTYIAGCENIMKKHPSWFLPDKIHPTQKGHNAIAKLMAKKLTRYGL